MKKGWFRSVGWIYLPIRWQGFLITFLVLAFCLQVFFFVDSRSHSVSDTFYGVFPYIVPALGLLLWIASKTVKGKK